ncbi:MAG: glycosyltransferase [Verrucomicrobia bacterium]|nr:glycosyltransferase [Verrucomicrobiota bacterium]
MRLSIVVPAHNEESRIRPMLDAYLGFFNSRYGDQVEFIVVVNGSTDHTDRVVDEYAAKHSNLRCIVEPRQVGKGGALMLGFKAAAGELIGFADADGSTPPEAFQDLVDKIADKAVIIASRWCAGANVSPRQPLRRRIASRGFNIMTRLLFGLRLTDTQCGAKLMKRDALLEVMPSLGITRWAFDVDLLFQLKRAGRKLTEIPTVWQDVIGGSVEVVRTSFEMMAALIRLRLIYSPLKWTVTAYDKTLGRLFHQELPDDDKLFRHSFVLLVGAQVSNICNIAFQLVMIRMLTEVAFGVLASMLGIFLVFATPLGALGPTIAHFTAHILKGEDGKRVKEMLVSILCDLTVVAVVILAAAYLGRDRLSGFFQLGDSAPVLITAVILVLTLYSPVFSGALQGVQAFGWLSGVGVAQASSRLVLGGIAIGLGGAAVMALSAHAVSIFLAVLLSVAGMNSVLGAGFARPRRIRGLYPYFLKYMLAFGACSVLMNADVILVKHYFDPAEAGLFSRAAVVGRLIIFLPQPIAMAMFPKVVTGGEVSRGTARTLVKAILLVSLVIVSVAVVCTLIPGLALRVLTGDSSEDLIPVVRGMAWGLCPLSITFVLMNFELAQRRFFITLPLVGCAIAYVIGVAVWHKTFMQVVFVLIVVSILSLLSSVACMPWKSLRREQRKGKRTYE